MLSDWCRISRLLKIQSLFVNFFWSTIKIFKAYMTRLSLVFHFRSSQDSDPSYIWTFSLIIWKWGNYLRVLRLKVKNWLGLPWFLLVTKKWFRIDHFILNFLTWKLHFLNSLSQMAKIRLWSSFSNKTHISRDR